MMNTGDEDVTEFISTEVEAKNNRHFPFSADANAGNAEQKVKRIKMDSRIAESLSEQLREERRQISITSLPQELIAMIFSHLEAHFLSTTVTHVCRYFHNVLKSKGFWKSRKTLYINAKESGNNFIKKIIPKCPNVRHLNVNFCCKVPKPSLTVPNKSFRYLRSLVMTNVYSRTENAVEMIVQSAPHLRVLKLQGETTEKMLEALVPAKELTTFSIRCRNQCFIEYEPILTNVFKSCPKLETVYVKLVNDVDVEPLVTLLEVCSGTLKRLSWNGELSDPVMKKLSTCPQILHLEILGTGITDESVKFIRNMKQIETLRLYSYFIFDDTLRLTSDGYIEMFKNNAFPLLKHLSFDDCEEVDDTVLEKIAPNLKDLESLALNNTNITNIGIGFVLAHCSNLRALRVFHFKIEYSFVKVLSVCCPRLQFLGLFNKPVPEHIIDQFLYTHPSFNFKKCEELTALNFDDLSTVNLSDITLKPMIAYKGDDHVKYIIGHK